MRKDQYRQGKARGTAPPRDPLVDADETDFDPLLDPFDPGDMGVAAAELPAYRRLHASYAVVVLVLVATGLPIQFPDLRAALIGGYGRSVATIHEWAGLAMLALPAIALAVSPREAIDIISIRSYRRTDLGLHAINLWFTLLAGVVFIVTGFVMWFPSSVPDSILDGSADIHGALGYALYVMIPLHLIAARKRIGLALVEFKTRMQRDEERGNPSQTGGRQ